MFRQSYLWLSLNQYISLAIYCKSKILIALRILLPRDLGHKVAFYITWKKNGWLLRWYLPGNMFYNHQIGRCVFFSVWPNIILELLSPYHSDNCTLVCFITKQVQYLVLAETANCSSTFTVRETAKGKTATSQSNV